MVETFRLILASGSPARRELLQGAGYSFEVIPADIEEPAGHDYSDPRELVQQTAWLKAAAVAPRVDAGRVLAADTVGWIGGQAVGKPADGRGSREDRDRDLATRQWQGCSGAYAIQERDDPYVRLVEGSQSNVVGLPMESLARLLPCLIDMS